ncbi:MAG: glycosyltransferase family 2 protein, partial [Candidatus Aerophobetes bacterium]|nr:glycosyltransferase family 2 protein [Candidatus Aerophobetes bacterium]
MKESISVILPAFNEGENVEPVVSSALRFLPTLTNHYEVIIVDDGSKDNTGEIADRLARGQKEIVVVHHPFNKGYGAAL